MEKNRENQLKISDCLMLHYERIVLIDIETGDYYTYFDSTNDYYKISEYGVHDERIVYMKYYFVHKEDKEHYEASISMKSLKELLDGAEQELVYHFRVLSNDDEYRWKCYRIRYLDADRSTIILSVQDEHGSRQEEQRYGDSAREAIIDALEETKKSSESYHAFYEIITKELRSKLLMVGGESSLVPGDEDGTSILKRKLSRIHEVSNYLFKLTDKMSHMNQLDSGMFHSERIKTDLFTFIKGICDEQMRKAKKKGVEVCGEVNLRKECSYFANPAQISNILVNVISNAVSSSKEGGTVNLTINEEIIGDDESLLCITVEDRGVYDVSMMLCERVVERMGGKKKIIHRGEGQDYFTVEVPIGYIGNSKEEMSPKDESKKDLPPEELRNINIFLVETYENNYNRIGTLLRENDIGFDVVYSGYEALRLWEISKKNTYTAIIVDSNLQDMSYLHLVEKIKKIEPERARVSIIAIGENFIIDDIKEGYRAGINANISKPVDVNKLLEVLNRLKVSRKERR